MYTTLVKQRFPRKEKELCIKEKLMLFFIKIKIYFFLEDNIKKKKAID